MIEDTRVIAALTTLNRYRLGTVGNLDKMKRYFYFFRGVYNDVIIISAFERTNGHVRVAWAKNINKVERAEAWNPTWLEILYADLNKGSRPEFNRVLELDLNRTVYMFGEHRDPLSVLSEILESYRLSSLNFIPEGKVIKGNIWKTAYRMGALPYYTK